MNPCLGGLWRRILVRSVLALAWGAAAAADVVRSFDIPATDAEIALMQFAAQSGIDLIFSTEVVKGVRTRELKGEHARDRALEQLLAGTSLRVAGDRRNGVVRIARAAAPHRSASGISPTQTTPPPMNRRTPVAFITSWLALMFGPAHVSVAAEGGSSAATFTVGASITGQVSNAVTRAFLEGATVTVAGTGRSVTTDREGRYVISGVTGDTVVLEVSFTGLDPRRVSVPLAGGQRIVRDVELNSDIYKMEKFSVAGQREGTALAETLQRLAPNVKNVVSSDTFGNVADGNVGNFLQHIAGITAEYTNQEVRQVMIRGIGGDLNSMTMDGQQMATGNSFGTGRAFEFEQASLGNVETIEVTKAPTPDMDGASIGGAVNLVSKSAFDRAPGRLISYTLGFATLPGYPGKTESWKAPIKGFGPSVNFSYSDVVGANRRLGITLTGTFHSQPIGGADIQKAFERRNEPGPVFTYSTNRRMFNGTTSSRISSSLKLDYRWSDQTTVSLNTMYNFYHQNSDTRAHTLSTVGVATAATPQLLATVDAAGNRTGGGYIHPNYSDGITRIFPHPTLSLSSISVNTNDKSGQTVLFSPSARHRFDGLSIDYSASYSNSATYYDASHRNEKYRGGQPQGTVTMSLGNVGWTVDRTRDPTWPTITQTSGPDIYNLANYSALRISQPDIRISDRVYAARFDLKKDLRLALPVWFKVGGRHQRQMRKFWADRRRFDYTGPDGILGNADDTRDVGQFADTGREVTDDEKKYYQNRGGVPPWVNAFAVARHQRENPQLWKEDITFGTQERLKLLKAQEDISAAYLMGNVRLGKLSLLAGARMEWSDSEGEGPLNYLSPAERARRAAYVGVVTDAELERRAIAQFGGRQTVSGGYHVVLPGVHLKYEPFGGLVTRLSWSTGIGRPDFGAIIPNDVVDDTARRVTTSNPGLKPQYANNFDLSLEYYFKPQGMISIGAFQKKIEDYIYTDTSQIVGTGRDNGFEGEYEGYALTTRANGGSAEIKGVEFSYQQQLTFLPGWTKGFGVYTNYTLLKTKGNYGGAVVLTNHSLPGFLPKTGNVGLSYRGYGLDLRLQANYRGQYLRTNSPTPALVQWQRSKVTWTWKSRYAVSRHLSLYCDLENLFEVPLDTVYSGFADRVTSYRTFHLKITGGITGRF